MITSILRTRVNIKTFTTAVSEFRYSTFYSREIQIQKASNIKKKPSFDSTLKFGEISTDHMLEIVWRSDEGWGTPKIVPFHNFEIHPFNSSFHYAFSCFEGLKAYKDPQNRVLLFRPKKNMERFQKSFLRLSFPDFDPEQLLQCVKQLVKLEKDWIPQKQGFSLYIRPTGISFTDKLGIRPPDSVLLYVCCSPVGPYYPSGLKPISLYATSDHIRAAYGGSGQYKISANYAPTVIVSMAAEKKGYTQVLWLTNGYVTEVGTSNFMVRWINEHGEDEVVTPPLDDGLILPGITRDSILSLLREKQKIKVSERKFTIEELVKAATEKKIIEAFACGTAAVVSPIKLIHYDGMDYKIPINEKINAGELTNELMNELCSIQYGVLPHKWSMVIDETHENSDFSSDAYQ